MFEKFEIQVNVKVRPDDKGAPGRAFVETTVSLNGEEKKKLTDDFSNVFMAYIFLGDYFYDMVERLVVRSATLDPMVFLNSLQPPEVN